MEVIASGNRKKIFKTVLFILVMAILSSLLLVGNFSLTYFIGNGVIYTGVIAFFLIMTIMMTTYFRYFKREMTIIDTLVVGFPVFIISTIAGFVIMNYDFEGTVVYSYYSKGYYFHVLEETAKQFIPTTLFFTLIFAPLYRQIRKSADNSKLFK